MNNSPALWDKLLAQAPKGSVLMGGAVVDFLLNLPVNDFDIFYTYHPGMGFVLPGNWVPTEANFNDPVWAEQHQEMYLQGVGEGGLNPISVVYEYMVDGVHKVQMIGVNYDKPIKHMANFDHSLTLASYDAKGLFVSKKVFQSYDSKVIEYVSKNKEHKAVVKSMGRAQKKIQKMPDGVFEWKFKGFELQQPQVIVQPFQPEFNALDLE